MAAGAAPTPTAEANSVVAICELPYAYRMALNPREIAILSGLLGRMNLDRRPRVLLLGYPDILATPQSLAQAGVPLDWAELEKRSAMASRQVWINAGKDHLANLPMLEARSLFRRLGGDPTVSDAIARGQEDRLIDLNKPVEDAMLLGAFDLIVDPGTLEHCFNIAQAFDNVDRMLAPDGFIYHQAAAAFPNHGFWSISPTAFFDFYEQRGYRLGRAYYWHDAEDVDGLIPRLVPAAPFEQQLPSAQNRIASYVFQSSGAQPGKGAGYPTQRIYTTANKTLAVHDFIASGTVRYGRDPYRDRLGDVLQKVPALRAVLNTVLPVPVIRALKRVVLHRY